MLESAVRIVQRRRVLRQSLKSHMSVLLGIMCLGLGHPWCWSKDADPPPNFIILFTDDQGYGDLGCYGHPTIQTPNLDQMADEGLRFTQFYVAAAVCTPSRAALLTGRLPVRSGMTGIFRPDSKGGLPQQEVTIAEILKTKGYATACIGKWHLGHLPQYLPTRQGFDVYYGVPYSNDMGKVIPLPLMRQEEIIEQPVDQTTLTGKYTREAVKFLETHKEQPFFLYLPHTFPHRPLYVHDTFRGSSKRGLYGDVIAEIDWSVGKILDTLRALGLDKRTMVVFTSDNGPAYHNGPDGGSAGLLRGGKATTWEGGMRVPCIAWWPGRIAAGQVTSELVSAMDLFTTLAMLAGCVVPTDRVIDGLDVRPVLFARKKSPRELLFYYWGEKLYAVRKGPWKVHFRTQTRVYRAKTVRQTHDPPLLFHLEHDPGEHYNVAHAHADVIDDIKRAIAEHEAHLIRREFVR